MANLRVKEVGNAPNVEVGDMVITKNIERLIIKRGDKYLAVCPTDMVAYGEFSSLESLRQCYCSDSYRIIKAKSLTIVEE